MIVDIDDPLTCLLLTTHSARPECLVLHENIDSVNVPFRKHRHQGGLICYCILIVYFMFILDDGFLRNRQHLAGCLFKSSCVYKDIFKFSVVSLLCCCYCNDYVLPMLYFTYV